MEDDKASLKMPAVPKTPNQPDKPLRQESMKKFIQNTTVVSLVAAYLAT